MPPIIWYPIHLSVGVVGVNVDIKPVPIVVAAVPASAHGK